MRLYPKNNDPQQLQRIADVLNDGGVIIYPTGTTYALGCHALKERAVERICRIKGVEPEKQLLSIVCYDISNISEFAKIETPVFKLMKRHLPGPFTFILPGTRALPKVFSKRGEVGIRMPNSPIVTEILSHLEAPLLTASLPIDDEDDAQDFLNPELVEERFGNLIDLMVEAGQGKPGQTTIVKCTEGEPEVVRQGDGWLDI